MPNCNFSFPWYNYMCQQQICPPNAIHLPYMQISSCTHLRQLCQHKYLKQYQCNQQCHHMNWYAYISHYWHKPLNKYACHFAYVCVTALLLSLHVDSTLLHIQVKQVRLLSSAVYMHIYNAFGNHIYSLSSMTKYVLLVWQTYLLCSGQWLWKLYTRV